MKVIELDQGTREWHAWRSQHLGASDASLIGANFLPETCEWPYEGWPGAELFKLWGEKTGRRALKEDKDQSHGDYVDPKAQGHKNEQAALEWYMGQRKTLVFPACVEHDELKFAAASLDGITEDQSLIVEIKCPQEPETWEIAKAGRVPAQYIAQVQHQLFVTGAELCHFVVWYRREGVWVDVKRNERFIAELTNHEAEFWSWVESGVFPLPTGEMEMDGDEGWKMAVDRYLTAQAQVRFGEANLRRAKVGLMKMMPSAKVVGAGVRVSISIKPGHAVKAFTVEESLSLMVNHLS